MKKFLAVVLALVMIMSLAAVSFASSGSAAPIGTYQFVRIGSAPLHYDADSYYDDRYGDHLMMDNGFICYSTAAYYPIIFTDGNREFVASDYDLIDNLKVKASFTQGENLVNGVEIVKMNVANVQGTTSPQAVGLVEGVNPRDYWDADANLLKYCIDNTGNNYYYFVKIGVNPYFTTGEDDIIGTLTFNQKADKDLNINGAKADILKTDDVECDVEINVHMERHYNDFKFATGQALVDRDVSLEYDRAYALKFDNDGEVEIEFGGKNPGGRNEGKFTVDVSGQGKVLLMVTTEANEAIANANPDADMFFLNFAMPVKFNRAGEFTYEMEDIAAVYKVVNNQLVEIPGAEFDGDEVTFTTNLLTNYVFATSELVNPVA